MPGLSETQRAMLTTAVARKNRCLYPIAAALKGGAVGNVARSLLKRLLKRGLVKEVPAGKNTVWRHGEDGAALTCVRAPKLIPCGQRFISSLQPVCRWQAGPRRFSREDVQKKDPSPEGRGASEV